MEAYLLSVGKNHETRVGARLMSINLAQKFNRMCDLFIYLFICNTWGGICSGFAVRLLLFGSLKQYIIYSLILDLLSKKCLYHGFERSAKRVQQSRFADIS